MFHVIFDGACRAAALVLGSALTGYGAWLSYNHFGSILGPLVAISAAALLVLSEHSWRKARARAIALGVLGVVAAVLSGLVVADRIAAGQEARAQTTRDANLPRVAAEKALQDEKVALKLATEAAQAECASGRKARCLSLEEREEAARKRVSEAQAALVKLGAVATEDHIAVLFGAWAGFYRVALPLALPAWAEIAAPLLLAFGLRPGKPKRPVVVRKAKRRKPRSPKPPGAVKPKPPRLGSSPLRATDNVVELRRPRRLH
jgi:hypothetical protein